MKSLHLCVCGAILLGVVVAGLGQGTAFLYQGQLTANGFPANGAYDLTFTLLNAGGPTGSTLTNPATAVSNGLFSVALDFGPGVFNGSNLWLQIGVRTNGGGGGFTALSPMQPILAAPYAVLAATAGNLSGPLPAAQLSGAYPGDITLDNAANRFAGSFAGDGSGLTNVNAAWLNGLAGSNYAMLNVLTNYATVASLTNASAAAAIPALQVYDAPGTTNFSIPAGVTQIAIEVWGGGGGGGNAGSGTGSMASAGGGGAGGYGKGVFAVTPGSNYTVVVGAGGGTNGIAGGASSFGALISAGGGSAGPSAPTSHGGAGGSSSAPINITGGAGQWSSSEGGNGGGSVGNGGSGGLGDSGSAGGPGQVPGGGGGGGFDLNDPGGPGGHGRIIIYY